MEVEGKSPSGHRPEGRSAVGIMLADPGHRPATEAERRRLADAVAQRGWSLSLRTGIATALADLCLAEREERARESWGLPPRHDLVLLLVGGFYPETLDLLVRALRDHAPRTGVYRWDGRRILAHGPGGPPPSEPPEGGDDRHRRWMPDRPGAAADDPIDGPGPGSSPRSERRTGSTVGAPQPVASAPDRGSREPRNDEEAGAGESRTHDAKVTESPLATVGSRRQIAP